MIRALVGGLPIGALIALICAASGTLRAQIQVEGVVASRLDSVPLPGITVRVAGSQHGTVTDGRGVFRLRIAQPLPVVLQFQGVGVEPHEVSIATRPGCALHVCLHESSHAIGSVVITGASAAMRREQAAVAVVRGVGREALARHLAPSLAQTLAHVPGVHSMSVGSGVSKPMIRGMGFNRIAVIDRGIKQEGQQWGADHGLELDQHAVQSLGIYKGAMSLQYGGDAMGGAIVVNDNVPGPAHGARGNARLWARSNGWLLGASAGSSYRGQRLFVVTQLTAQQYGDYSVPADTVVYLTQRIPIHGRRLKNTAGHEVAGTLTLGAEGGWGVWALTASHVQQKMGFFPGAHGVPDAARVRDDGRARNIDHPYAGVGHTKLIINHQSPKLGAWRVVSSVGWQRNAREERALFHTHYPNQPAPTRSPDLELQFRLWTLSARARGEWAFAEGSRLALGVDGQLQRHGTGGYSFLLPRYGRVAAGAFATASWRAGEALILEGGARYDAAWLRIEPHTDGVLHDYLRAQGGYSEAQARAYSQRSVGLRRRLGNVSWGVGANWQPARQWRLKLHAGQSYRLPSVNELSANGVHHGSYRHERGDGALRPEQGYQLDAELRYQSEVLTASVSPFVAYYTNFIYLNPSGQWSVLPHAGQVYLFEQSRALSWGGEAELHAHLGERLTLGASGSYVAQRNPVDGYPLPFTPQPTVGGHAGWYPLGHHGSLGTLTLALEPQYALAQREVARNEEPTEGGLRLNARAEYATRVGRLALTLRAGVENALNARYYNHLSYYRKLQIPEPGRSFRLGLSCSW